MLSAGQHQIPIDVFGYLCNALNDRAAGIAATAFDKAHGNFHSAVNPSDEKIKYVLYRIKAARPDTDRIDRRLICRQQRYTRVHELMHWTTHRQH